jgi:hypothetical protein
MVMRVTKLSVCVFVAAIMETLYAIISPEPAQTRPAYFLNALRKVTSGLSTALHIAGFHNWMAFCAASGSAPFLAGVKGRAFAKRALHEHMPRRSMTRLIDTSPIMPATGKVAQ